MKFFLITALTLLFACQHGREPLVAGRDVCSFCKMPYADARFGGELISSKGKIFKFDDVECMINYLKSESDDNAESILAVEYLEKKLVHVDSLVFVRSNSFHSPMNSGIAAFASGNAAQTALSGTSSEILSWQKLFLAGE